MKKLKRLFRSLSYKHLSRTIAGFGYEYSFKNHIAKVLLTLFGMSVVGYLYYLTIPKIVMLGVISIFALGVIVMAQFRFLSNNDRFEAMSNYIEMMILNFKQQPKILNSLELTLEYVSTNTDMKRVVEEAIKIIKTDVYSENVYKRAFGVIEEEFPSSRLRTLHSFLINVELESSTDYHDALDSLYFDIREWITRTYQYQAELNALKKKITMIIILSVGIAAYFARLLRVAETGMTDAGGLSITGGAVFQYASLIYLASFILLYTVLQAKVNGQWLVNDLDHRNDKKILKDMDFINNYSEKKERRKSILAALICFMLVVAGFVIHSMPVMIGGMVITVICLVKPSMTYKTRKKNVERALVREFPVWLRELSVRLNNMVVLRAIESSIEDSASVIKPFLENFVSEAEMNPTSIAPYKNFLGKFSSAEIATAFKTLYAVQMLSKDDSRKYINDLVSRNQALIEKSERMRNDDSLGSVTFISLAPMLLMSLKLLLDMGLILVYFFQLAAVA